MFGARQWGRLISGGWNFCDDILRGRPVDPLLSDRGGALCSWLAYRYVWWKEVPGVLESDRTVGQHSDWCSTELHIISYIYVDIIEMHHGVIPGIGCISHAWLFIISHDSTAENYGYLNLRTTSPLQMMSWTSAWRRKSWSLGLAFWKATNWKERAPRGTR